MAGTIEFPQVVLDALQHFGDLFANEPQCRHFDEYSPACLSPSAKRSWGFAKNLPHTTDQSCLNRFLTEVCWADQKLTTVGEACRAMLRETLWDTITWMMEHATEHACEVPQVLSNLKLTQEPCIQ